MVIPYREEMAKRHLKPLGDLGKIVFMVSTEQRHKTGWRGGC